LIPPRSHFADNTARTLSALPVRDRGADGIGAAIAAGITVTSFFVR